MNYNINKSILGIVVLVLFVTPFVISQNNDTIVFKQNDSIPAGYWWVKKKTKVFAGKIILTQNGLSPAPTFSLDKPAVLFRLTMGGKRLAFEPDIRFSLRGKPWAFLLWARLKAIDRDKFKMKFGVHPGFNFRTKNVLIDGAYSDIIQCRRYVGADYTQSWEISDHFSLGSYYFYSRCVDDTPLNTHFALISTNFKIDLFGDYQLGFSPSFYYLRLDNLDGIYFTSSFQFRKTDFPLSLDAIINQKINSKILPQRVFVWNISLVYSFKKPYFESPVGI